MKVFTKTICLFLILSISSCSKKEENPISDFFLLAGASQVISCNRNASKLQAGRSFRTSFESVSEFDGFYIVPQNYQNAATHDLSTAQVRTGINSHRGYIYSPTTPCISNCNHRAYPTIQLHKTAQGSFRTPVLVEFYSYLTMDVPDDRWFSFATFSTDASDVWSRTVLVNLGNLNKGTTNYMHLMHVPFQGRSDWSYQVSDSNSPLAYPQSEWVKISVCLDFEPGKGSAKVFQNGILVSAAPVSDGCGLLEQAHFGLYAPAELPSGVIYNDDLSITEVSVCPY